MGGGQGGDAGGSSPGGMGGGGGQVAVDCGTIDLAPDDFDDGVRDPDQWNEYSDQGGAVDETTGQLVLTIGPSTSSDAYYESRGLMNLVGRSLAVEVPAVTTLTSADMDFEVAMDTRNRFLLRHHDGSLQAYKVVNGLGTVVLDIAYNATNHRYWQLRATDESMNYEASADGVTYTKLAEVDYTAAFIPDNVRVRLDLDNIGMIVDSAIFDNLVVDAPSPGSWCAADSLVDDFSAPTHGRQWRDSVGDGNATVVRSDGMLFLTPNPGESTGYEYRSSKLFDLTGSSVTVELAQALTTPGRTALRLTNSADWFAFEIIGDPEMMGDPTDPVLAVSYRSNNATSPVVTEPYSPSSHRWLRIRDDAGTIVWEVSGDGASWDSIGSVSPPPFEIDDLRIELEAIADAANPEPGQAIFDNVNNAP
jgi:hypothetical protein